VFCDSAIVPQSPQLFQNGGLSVLYPIGETEKSCRGPSQANRVGGGRQSCCFLSDIPW
jgi:hypothetical protein